MFLLFIESPEPISPHRLHHPDQHITIEILAKFLPVNRMHFFQFIKIDINQLFADVLWDIRFGVV